MFINYCIAFVVSVINFYFSDFLTNNFLKNVIFFKNKTTNIRKLFKIYIMIN